MEVPSQATAAAKAMPSPRSWSSSSAPGGPGGDLHDGLGPTLAGAVLTIDAARRVLATDPEAADALLDRAAESVEGTVAEVRRVVYGLRPPALDQLGLVGALRQHAATFT